MADEKLSGQTEATDLALDDLLYALLAAGGATDDRKFTKRTLMRFQQDAIKTAIDVNPAVPFKNYVYDSSGGAKVHTLPNVVAGNTDWFSITLGSNGNHVIVTTVGGTQIIGGGTATSRGVFTEGTTLIVRADGVDAYDIVLDNRVYYRVVEVTGDLDLSGGYESGAIYRCISATSAQINIQIPDTSEDNIGLYCKFVLGTDNGTSIRITTENDEDIGTTAEQFVLEPSKGLEVADVGDGYLVTQDSRTSAANVAINFYPTDNVSVLDGSYFDLTTLQPVTGVVASAAITSIDSENPTTLGFWINDNKALAGTIPETTINGYAQLRLTSAFNRTCRIKFEYYEYDYGTDTLNPVPLSETSYSGVIDNLTIFQEYFIGGILPENSWGESSIAGKTIVAKLLGFKSSAAGDDPTIDFQTGTSRTVVAAPVTSVNHGALGGVVGTGPQTKDGHVDNAVQEFFGLKTIKEMTGQNKPHAIASVTGEWDIDPTKPDFQVGTLTENTELIVPTHSFGSGEGAVIIIETNVDAGGAYALTINAGFAAMDSGTLPTPSTDADAKDYYVLIGNEAGWSLGQFGKDVS